MTVPAQVTKLMIAVTLVHTGKKLEVKGAKNVKGQEDQSQGLKKEAGATEEVPASALTLATALKQESIVDVKTNLGLVLEDHHSQVVEASQLQVRLQLDLYTGKEEEKEKR